MDSERALPLEHLSDYPVTLAQWHWRFNGIPTPISGDPYQQKEN